QDHSCCSSGNANIEFTDADGLWGVENGDWCHMINDNASTTPSLTPEPAIPRYR
ncbi:hypothetical protein LY90DRAFT_431204, partial [Neocallimastix californiae]